MSPTKHRGAFINGFKLSQGIGFILASLINFIVRKSNGSYGWRLCLSLAAAPASFLTLGALFLPETPTSLIQRNHNLQKAVGILQRIRGTPDILTELNDIVGACTGDEHSPAIINGPLPHRQIIGKRKYRPQLVMAISIPFFAQVAGFNLMAFYAPIMLESVGFDEIDAPLMSAVALGLMGSCANAASMVVVDRLGRRALFMIGGAQMLVAQLMIGGVLMAGNWDIDDEGGSLSRRYAYLVLAMICVFVTGFEWSWGPLGWLVPSEIFPLEIRSAGQSIAVASNFLSAFAVAQTFPTMVCGALKAGIFFFFGGWITVMSGFVYFLLPETKNVPMEQMELVWREHWFWGKMYS